MQHAECISEIRTREDFFHELEREIARVRRYGHRITLLLIEPEIKLDGAQMEEFRVQFFKQLRSSDCAYVYDDRKFAAILPDTHEAGGEAAALRIKRRICSALAEKSINISLSIGVVSLDAGVSKDIQELVIDLEHDLGRDRQCQAIDLQEVKTEKPESEVVLVCGTGLQFISELADIAGSEYNIRDVTSDTLLENLSTQDCQVVVMGMNVPMEEKKSLTREIRFNRELNITYIVWLQDENVPESRDPDFSCDLLLPEEVTPPLLWPVLRHGFVIISLKQKCGNTDQFKGMLDSIGSAAHQLNQPIQIILGRLELFMLNMDETPENESFLNDIKTMRRQALLAADINKKIGRLSKYK